MYALILDQLQKLNSHATTPDLFHSGDRHNALTACATRASLFRIGSSCSNKADEHCKPRLCYPTSMLRKVRCTSRYYLLLVYIVSSTQFTVKHIQPKMSPLFASAIVHSCQARSVYRNAEHVYC